MTPCAYDGYNYQSTGDNFAVLDLWRNTQWVHYSHRRELDKAVYDATYKHYNVSLPS